MAALSGDVEEPVEDLLRLLHRRRHMALSVPGNIVEVDGFLVVDVAVAAQFQRAKWCLLPDLVRDDLIECASERVTLWG